MGRCDIRHWTVRPKKCGVLDNISMVSLRELSAELGSHLVPVEGLRTSSRRLSGVHVSELEDPTPYLEGGELLLTTGMPLGSGVDVEAYVRRLHECGVSVLGLGLGPRIAEVPEGLITACRLFDVDLLVVPDGVPFQSVSRAFWRLNERSGKAELMSSLGTQTALARAAMRLDAAAAVVRGLAQEVHGWAAYLPGAEAAEGESATYWPSSTEALLPRLEAETLRLNRTGVHSAATFEVQGRPVVEYPIADGDKILGFLAIGPGRELTAADRQIILTVCTLLAIKHRQRRSSLRVAKTFGAAVTRLLLAGQTDAARLVAEEAGLPDLPPRVRILVLEHAESKDHDVDSVLGMVPQMPRAPGVPVLDASTAETLLLHHESGLTYVVLTGQQLSADSVGEPPRRVPTGSSGSDLRAALSELVPLQDVPHRLPALRRAVRRAPRGILVSAEEDARTVADAWVDSLAAHTGADLVGTVVSYVRHRGQWEAAARELGLHRNSVRHRISTAESLLGVDLNDPDVFAPLWLALQEAPTGASALSPRSCSDRLIR